MRQLSQRMSGVGMSMLSLFRMVKVQVPKPTKVKRVRDDVVQQLIATANGTVKATWFVPLIKFAVADRVTSSGTCRTPLE